MPDPNEDERQLIRGLDALAQLERTEEGAPAAVKARLRETFHRRTRRQPARWLLLAAAAAILVLTLSPVHQRAIPAAPDLAPFIRLDSEPVSAGIVVRVKLPRSVLFDEGTAGEVEADVLLGDDGRAHAVRFIE